MRNEHQNIFCFTVSFYFWPKIPIIPSSEETTADKHCAWKEHLTWTVCKWPGRKRQQQPGQSHLEPRTLSLSQSDSHSEQGWGRTLYGELEAKGHIQPSGSCSPTSDSCFNWETSWLTDLNSLFYWTRDWNMILVFISFCKIWNDLLGAPAIKTNDPLCEM